MSDREFLVFLGTLINFFAIGFHVGMFFGFRKKPRKAKKPPKA
jgi:hypothetical protein